MSLELVVPRFVPVSGCRARACLSRGPLGWSMRRVHCVSFKQVCSWFSHCLREYSSGIVLLLALALTCGLLHMRCVVCCVGLVLLLPLLLLLTHTGSNLHPSTSWMRLMQRWTSTTRRTLAR